MRQHYMGEFAEERQEMAEILEEDGWGFILRL
jgi:hypothetical protein